MALVQNIFFFCLQCSVRKIIQDSHEKAIKEKSTRKRQNIAENAIHILYKLEHLYMPQESLKH